MWVQTVLGHCLNFGISLSFFLYDASRLHTAFAFLLTLQLQKQGILHFSAKCCKLPTKKIRSQKIIFQGFTKLPSKFFLCSCWSHGSRKWLYRAGQEVFCIHILSPPRSPCHGRGGCVLPSLHNLIVFLDKQMKNQISPHIGMTFSPQTFG